MKLYVLDRVVNDSARLDLTTANRIRRALLLIVEQLHHHVGRLDQSSDAVTLFQAQFAHRVCGDDGGDVDVTGADDDLCEKTVDLDTDDFACELIPAADTPKASAGFRLGLRAVLGEEGLQRTLRNAMVAAGRQGGLQLPVQDPLLDRGITDSYQSSRFTRCEHGGRWCHGLGIYQLAFADGWGSPARCKTRA
jgi:hypothetical protein